MLLANTLVEHIKQRGGQVVLGLFPPLMQMQSLFWEAARAKHLTVVMMPPGPNTTTALKTLLSHIPLDALIVPSGELHAVWEVLPDSHRESIYIQVLAEYGIKPLLPEGCRCDIVEV